MLRGVAFECGSSSRRQANNWACAAAQHHHHKALLEAGVRILEYLTMLHVKAFVRDGEDFSAGTRNLEAWSLRRFFEIDLLVRSPEPCEAVRRAVLGAGRGRLEPGRTLVGARERARARAFATISPLLSTSGRMDFAHYPGRLPQTPSEAKEASSTSSAGPDVPCAQVQ